MATLYFVLVHEHGQPAWQYWARKGQPTQERAKARTFTGAQVHVLKRTLTTKLAGYDVVVVAATDTTNTPVWRWSFPSQ